jgi:hypothetical protein
MVSFERDNLHNVRVCLQGFQIACDGRSVPAAQLQTHPVFPECYKDTATGSNEKKSYHGITMRRLASTRATSTISAITTIVVQSLVFIVKFSTKKNKPIVQWNEEEPRRTKNKNKSKQKHDTNNFGGLCMSGRDKTFVRRFLRVAK